MGNYRFKFSDMIPNAWFYKLKDTSTTKTKTPKTHQTKKKHEPQPQPPRPVTTSSSFSSSTSSSLPFAPPNSQRKSYYFTRDLTSPDLSIQTHTSPITRLPDPPRKSSKKRRSTKRSSIHHRKSSPRLVSAGCSTHTTVESVWAKPEYNPPDPYPSSSSGSDNGSLLPEFGSDRGSLDNMVSSLSSLQHCKLKNDDVDYSNISSDEKFQKIHDLPPIITKSSPKFEERNPYGSLSVKVVKQELQRRKFPANSPVKLRTNSPRIMARSRIMVQVNNGRRSLSSTTTSSGRLRRSLSESFAVAKSSVDPQRDFKESMVEMIMENNIRGSKDLEELLECYLSLNSDEYHELIIKVFKQIWFDISDIRFK